MLNCIYIPSGFMEKSFPTQTQSSPLFSELLLEYQNILLLGTEGGSLKGIKTWTWELENDLEMQLEELGF